MKFCDVCDNMLYVKVDTDEGLMFYCKNCNFTRTQNKDTSSLPLIAEKHTNGATKSELDDNCIVDINYSDDARNYSVFMTPNIKYDMTLPRVNNIPCVECEKKKNKAKPEVIYIKNDAANMKYLYFCYNCENFWRVEE